MSESSQVRVWDLFVRFFHWILFVAFAVAYISEGEPLWLHSWAGYTVGALIVLRIIWGFVGSKHARFSDFIYTPRTVVTYARDLLRRKSKRYVGHSPAGGAMILLLMVSLIGTAMSGMATLADTKNAGPLAPLLGHSAEMPGSASAITLISPAYADDDEHEGEEYGTAGRGERGESEFEEVHEVFANLTLFLAGIHLAGVLFASFAHRENLIRSMFTGRKRPEPEAG